MFCKQIVNYTEDALISKFFLDIISVEIQKERSWYEKGNYHV